MADAIVSDPTGILPAVSSGDARYGSYLNSGATTINKGEIVALTTLATNTGKAECHLASGTDTALLILGVATQAIAPGAVGQVQTAGWCANVQVSDAGAITAGSAVAFAAGTSVPGVADVASTGVAAFGVALGASAASAVNAILTVAVYIVKQPIS